MLVIDTADIQNPKTSHRFHAARNSSGNVIHSRGDVTLHARGLRKRQFKWRIGTAPNSDVVKSKKREYFGDDDSKAQATTLQLPNPMTILNKGNSDAFNVMVLSVDPIVNELLTFDTQFLTPFIMSTEKGHDRWGSYLNKMYQTSSTALYDERTVYSNLARIAAFKAVLADNVDTRTQALTFTAKAYTALRTGSSSAVLNGDLAIRILSVFSFEIFAKNFQAAAVHAHALQNIILQLKVTRQCVDQRFLNCLFFMEFKRSLLSWTTPIIDVQNLIPSETFVVLSTMVEHLERDGLLESGPPDGFIGIGIPQGDLLDEFLRALLLFRIGAVINNPIHRPGEKTRFYIESTTGGWAFAWGVNLHHVLQIHFLAMEASATALAGAHTQKRTAAVSLALLYWEYTAGNFDFINPDRAGWRQLAPVWSPTEQMLAELDKCINAIDWDNGDDVEACPELRLWLLYVCTLAEQVTIHIDKTPTGWFCTFNRAFASQAVKMGLLEWPDVVTSLRQYAFLPEFSVLSEPWFYACVSDIVHKGTDPDDHPY